MRLCKRAVSHSFGTSSGIALCGAWHENGSQIPRLWSTKVTEFFYWTCWNWKMWWIFCQMSGREEGFRFVIQTSPTSSQYHPFRNHDVLNSSCNCNCQNYWKPPRKLFLVTVFFLETVTVMILNLRTLKTLQSLKLFKRSKFPTCNDYQRVLKGGLDLRWVGPAILGSLMFAPKYHFCRACRSAAVKFSPEIVHESCHGKYRETSGEISLLLVPQETKLENAQNFSWQISRRFSRDVLQLQMPNFMAFFILQTFVLDKYIPTHSNKPFQSNWGQTWGTTNLQIPPPDGSNPPLGWPRSTVEKNPQSNESYERENPWNRTISTVLWVHKKLPQSTVKLVLPSNESYESKKGWNRTLATVLWVPLTLLKPTEILKDMISLQIRREIGHLESTLGALVHYLCSCNCKSCIPHMAVVGRCCRGALLWANAKWPPIPGFGKMLLHQTQDFRFGNFKGSARYLCWKGQGSARKHSCTMGFGKKCALRILGV